LVSTIQNLKNTHFCVKKVTKNFFLPFFFMIINVSSFDHIIDSSSSTGAVESSNVGGCGSIYSGAVERSNAGRTRRNGDLIDWLFA
jgi:hypothetical protein